MLTKCHSMDTLTKMEHVGNGEHGVKSVQFYKYMLFHLLEVHAPYLLH